MALNSMTGFARSEGVHDGWTLAFEIRGVNGRNLDLRLRLPPGFEALDRALRAQVQAVVARGNVQAVLDISDADRAGVMRIDEDRLARIVDVSERLVADGVATRPTADGLLALKGILDAGEARGVTDALIAEAERLFGAALADFSEARRREGAEIEAAIAERVTRIADLVKAARADPSRTPEAIAARLREQVARLAGQDLDTARLAQEAMLLAVKADIGEEIDRLDAHVAAARALLATDGPVGRRFDFLAQEMNRESNTICSKSNAVSLTAIGLEMKVAVDQLREQVQNVE